jgi:hypothetical protein
MGQIKFSMNESFIHHLAFKFKLFMLHGPDELSPERREPTFAFLPPHGQHTKSPGIRKMGKKNYVSYDQSLSAHNA